MICSGEVSYPINRLISNKQTLLVSDQSGEVGKKRKSKRLQIETEAMRIRETNGLGCARKQKIWVLIERSNPSIKKEQNGVVGGVYVCDIVVSDVLKDDDHLQIRV